MAVSLTPSPREGECGDAATGLTLNDKNAKMHFSNSKRQMEETSGHAEIEYPIHFKNSHRHFYANLTC